MSDRHLIFPDRALADVLKDMQRRITVLERRSQWLNRFGDASRILTLATVIDPALTIDDTPTLFERIETVMPAGAFLAIVRLQVELVDVDAFDTRVEAKFRVINLDAGSPPAFSGVITARQTQPGSLTADFVFPSVTAGHRLTVEVEAQIFDEGREDPPGTPDPLTDADVAFTTQLTIWQN